MNKIILTFFSAFLLAGCSATKMSVTQPSRTSSLVVNNLAIAPGSGVLGDAIALELFNLEIQVVDANEIAAIVGRAGLMEFEVTSTKGYALLREKGLTAVLTAKAVMARDGTPESVSVRVTDTTSGNLLAGVTWQNGWGGQRGSIADRTMRKNLSAAAQQIAHELYERLFPKK